VALEPSGPLVVDVEDALAVANQAGFLRQEDAQVYSSQAARHVAS
jgi:hypothetical protein